MCNQLLPAFSLNQESCQLDPESFPTHKGLLFGKWHIILKYFLYQYLSVMVLEFLQNRGIKLATYLESRLATCLEPRCFCMVYVFECTWEVLMETGRGEPVAPTLLLVATTTTSTEWTELGAERFACIISFNSLNNQLGIIPIL